MEALLRQAGAQPKRNLKCPFHTDQVASAEFKQVDNGKWYFYCHVCGIADDYWALKSRLEGIDVKELLSELNDNIGGNYVKPVKPSFATWKECFENWKDYKKPFKVEDIYPYTDPETGEYDFAVVRFIPREGEKKQFLQAHRNGDGKWRTEAPKGKTPLFNRLRIAESNNILIVEGEKCVKEFTKLRVSNWAATTNPGGANAVDKCDWSPVAGKTCYIWHDNDEAGLKHYESVKKILQNLGCIVNRVKVEELGLDVKEDIADYIESIDGLPEEKVAAVEGILLDSERLDISSALDQRLSDIATGKFKHIPFPSFPVLSNLSKALLPGTVTTLCGEPGAGKSFVILDNHWRWLLEHGIKVRTLMLEEDQAFHQQRLLAQLVRSSEVTNVDFCAENPEWVRERFEEFRQHIEYAARYITTVEKQMTLAQVAEWVEEQAFNTDCEVIQVDPVTAAEASDKPWIEDQKYLFRVKAAMEKTRKRLLQTNHPRTGKAGAPGLAGMAGGAAYPRFSQSVLWLRNYDEPEENRFFIAGSYQTHKHKQAFAICKARNGKGGGKNIGVNFNTETLNFEELGVISSDNS